MTKNEYLSKYVNYRPFKNMNELKDYFGEKLKKSLNVPKEMINLSNGIYLLRISDGKKILVDEKHTSINCVSVENKIMTMEMLLKQFVFYDESPCGIEEK